MALVLQTVEMVSSYVPYERPPQPFTLWTAIPRGLQSFLIPFQAVDIKPINDDYLLAATATLPPNFAYVMADGNLTITVNKASDFSDECNLNLQAFYRGTNAIDALSGNWAQGFQVDSPFAASRSLRMEQAWPTFPLVGEPGSSGVLINFSAWNTQDPASTAGTMTGYLSFWQFDLEQIRKYPINSPQPVHAR